MHSVNVTGTLHTCIMTVQQSIVFILREKISQPQLSLLYMEMMEIYLHVVTVYTCMYRQEQSFGLPNVETF